MDTPQARERAYGAKRRQRRMPLIWIVPIVTALIGGWLAWDTFSKRGPTITIAFQAADGLQAGQSQLKFRDVTMGTVKSITIAPDLTKVLATVETTREAESLLTDKTIFWVVKPQLFAGRISGLDTLLSGSYIGMLPSTAPGHKQHHFIGSPNPPILSTSEPGTVFKLHTTRVGAISLGSPIFYRDIDVGTVLGWDLDDMARHVTVHAFVRAPFDKYVHDDSVFWNASGLSVKLAPTASPVQLGRSGPCCWAASPSKRPRRPGSQRCAGCWSAGTASRSARSRGSAGLRSQGRPHRGAGALSRRRSRRSASRPPRRTKHPAGDSRRHHGQA
jgi:paraquat-inducible protein B